MDFLNTYLIYLIPVFGLVGIAAMAIKAAWVTKQDAGDGDMVKLSGYIADGAMAFLRAEWKVLSYFVVVAGILLAMWMYKNESRKADSISQSLGSLYKAAYKKFYIDEIYLFITKKIIFNLIGRPAAWIDRNIVDGLMNGIANTTATISGLIKVIQSGKVQSYAIYFFGGIVALTIVFLYLWK